MKNFIKSLIIVTIISAILCGTYYLKPLIYNPIDDVDSLLYQKSFGIIYRAKSPMFETKLSRTAELVTAENKLKELIFSKDWESDYKTRFNSILDSEKIELTEENKLFLDCAWGVWYAEYTAKSKELNSKFGIKNSVIETVSGLIFGGSAKKWRMYADNSYDMLFEANSEEDLIMLKSYLSARGIPNFE